MPIFAHQELDLHRVFWEVQARGGSELVTREKLWKARFYYTTLHYITLHFFRLVPGLLRGDVPGFDRLSDSIKIITWIVASLQEVCRSLGVDLTGQTSASYNMRVNYEKCLLDFEHYLASGQYAADVAAGVAPSPDHVSI